MTTLEQKAIAAVGCKRDNPKCLNCADYDCKKAIRGFIAGYTEALRWRDVNVELPELNQEFIGKMNVPEHWKDNVEFSTEHQLYKRISPIDDDCREKLLKDGCIVWRPIETI